VWQDFMFACFDYPDPTGALAAEVALEASYQVRRLRHHASLALWCGENEVQGIHEIVHGRLLPRGRGWELFHEVLPDVVTRLDPDRPYWPGSPWAERSDEILNGTQDGDRHAWEVWHGGSSGAGGPTEFASRAEERHFHRYDHDAGRFISEFGIHASPELSTLRRWAGEDLTGVGSPALLHRIKDTPQDKGFVLMQFETGEPATLEEYVDFSMAVQAEGLKHGVEHYRRRQPHCSGTLVWQLNDSWPGTSWSVIDYDLTPKASYYFLQRAYQPLLASFAVDADGLALWVSNSGHTAVDLDLDVTLRELGGSAAHTEQVRVVAEPYSSQPVWRSTDQPGRQTVAWVREAQDRLPANRRFFAPLKDLPLTGGEVTATVLDKAADRAAVELRAEGYCYLARLSSDLPGARFSTNYLDLLDGERRVVEVTDLPAGAGLTVASYGRPDHRVL
jgi:beta-mannosidase